MSNSLAIIFDMDGVLFNSEPLHIRAWQAAIAPLGHSFASEWYLPWIGIPDWQLAEYLQREFAVAASECDLLAQKREHYLRITTTELHAFDGLLEGLRGLSALGIPLAVATSSNREFCRHTLSCTGLLNFFPVCVAAEDVTRHKPAPDPYLRAAELLAVPAGKCTVIEDSPAGVRAARAAGCIVLAVTSSHPADTLHEADHIFPTTAAALQWELASRLSG